MAPGGATRNGPWCAREGSTQRCQRRSSCLVPWTWHSGSPETEAALAHVEGR